MRHQEAVQVRLQERYRRLYKSSSDSFDSNVRYFLDWVDQTPSVASLLSVIERSEPELGEATWWEGTGRGRAAWPDSEVGRCKVVLWLLRRMASGDMDARHVGHHLTGESRFDDAIRAMCADAVEPLFEYLQERLAAESDVLYLLERYRRRVLWFEQERLWAEYEDDTARGEAVYDHDLRRFLFEQGVDYPLSQPASPSGKADVLVGVEDDDPLACEVKLFLPGKYGVSYLAKGLQQAYRYATDYGFTTGYLVVFNLSDRPLELPTYGTAEEWPPRIVVADVTLFIVVVQAKPQKSASTDGAAKPVVARRGDLVKEL